MKSTMKKSSKGLKEPCFFIACLNPNNNLFLGKRYERTNQSASSISHSLQRSSGNVLMWLKECMTVWSISQQTVIPSQSGVQKWIIRWLMVFWIFLSIMTFSQSRQKIRHQWKLWRQARMWRKVVDYGSKKDNNGNCYKVWTDWTNVQQGTDSCICPFCKQKGLGGCPFLMKIKSYTMKTCWQFSWKIHERTGEIVWL